MQQDLPPTGDEMAATIPTPSRLEDDKLFRWLSSVIKADIDHWSAWRARAREEYAFVAGPGQWRQEDIAHLERQKRPVVTFNKTLKFVRAVCGVEKNNRQSIVYMPTDVTESAEVEANEMLTAASDWMAEGCKANRQQSRAVRDAVICGVGFTECLVDFDDDPRGKYSETRCNPLEMGWDKDARDDNLQDAKRIWRVRKMPRRDAIELLSSVRPDADKLSDFTIDATWASDISADTATTKTETEKERRDENSEETSENTVTLVQVQWIEREPYYRVANPINGQAMDVGEDEFKQLMAVAGELPHVRMWRKVYKQAWLGGELIASGPAPLKKGFSFACITWEPDDTDGSWFGIVRVLRDPQEWSNKFFSQMMHMINSTAKGGILAEEDAFTDIQQARDTYSSTDAITIVSKGALIKGKIQPKPGAAMSAGVMSLFGVAEEAFSAVSGINLELLGLADREQAGVLEAQRKQAAMTILADLFDSIGSFHETVGRARLEYIQRYFADDRMIRVYGDQGAKLVRLTKDETFGNYDVMAEDAPTSTNMKEKAWAGLTMLLPAVQHMLTPKIVMMLLDYVPYLPAKLVNSLKAMQQEPDPGAEEQAELAKRGQQAQIAKDEAAAQKSKSGAVLDLAKAGAEQAKAEESKVQALMGMFGLGPKRSKYAPATDGDIMGPAAGAMAPMPPLGAPRAAIDEPELPMAPPMANGGIRPPGGLQ